MCLMGAAEWAPYPAALRWLTTIYNQPQYLDAVGVVPPCQKAMVFDPAAGAYTRPLFTSTGAVSDTAYTLNIPHYPQHQLNNPRQPLKCIPYPTESAYVEPESGRV